MTVIQAVALAEDLKPIAARKKAMIIRKNPVSDEWTRRNCGKPLECAGRP